jgi:AraC-like DNA-binding protein
MPLRLMAMTQSVPPSIGVASGDPPPAGWAEQGREGFMKLNMQLDVINRSPVGRQFSVLAKSFGAIRVARVLGVPSTVIRARRHFADGRDLISVVITGPGRFQMEGVRGGQRCAVHGGAILESRSESALHSLDDSRGWTICLERASLEPLLAGIAPPLQRCLPCDDPAVRLLDGYLGTLFALGRDCDPALATMHIRDLALNALGVRGDVQALVRERGVNAARQSAVLEAIRRRADEPGLDPAQVAQAMGVSVRYLHRLLEPTGRSFSQHLLEQRLQRAIERLRDPTCHLGIADIARACGFADISHFNRSFRRAFGDTPYGVRVRAARRRDD